MRAFVGIEFSREIKDRIIKIQEIIRLESLRGRWKYIDNFHLTLKFLGEVNESQIDTIHSSMLSSFKDKKSFMLELKEVGFFRGDGCLRVIFMGVRDPGNDLGSMFEMTEECCSAAGVAREKRGYMPHITIAQDVVLIGKFDSIKERIDALPEIAVPVNGISIIQSQQVNNKRVYTPVKHLTLL